MIGKINFRKFGLVAIILLAGLLSVNISGALPPSEIIICRGCSLLQDSIDKFSTWVEKGAIITLTGPAGYQSYVWTRGGQTVYEQSITAKINSDTVYTLTLNGNKVKRVQVNLVSSEYSNCVPYLSEIKIDSTSLTVGQRVAISVDIDKSQCPDGSGAVFTWIIDEESLSGLFIENKNSEITWLLVKRKSSSGKNPIIRARATNGGQFREKNVTLNIVGNTPPTIAGLYFYTTPLSYKEITIDCDRCLTGIGTNENSDYISRLDVTVKNSQGKVVAMGSDSVNREDNRKPRVTITLGEECNCTIQVVAMDSFGASTIVRDILPVGFGNTEQDAPYIKLKTIYEREIYILDTSETDSHGLGFSRRYYVKTVSGFEPMYNINGSLCTSEKCTIKAGNYEVKITFQYIREGKPSGKMSEKIITVCAGCASAAVSYPLRTKIQPAVAAQSKVTVVPLPYSAEETVPEYRRKSSPGMEWFAAILALIIVALRRKKMNKC